MNRIRLLCASAACASFALAPGDAPERPTSPAAVVALKKYDTAVAKASDAYDRALAAADKQRIADLEAALKVAVNGKNLKESERIDAALAAAKAEAKDHAAGQAAGLLVLGKWRVTYLGGGTRTYVIERGGVVKLPAENRSGRLNSGTINLGDGKLERWTPVRDKVFVEHFDPASDFPTRPSQLGIGTQEQ